MRALLIHNPEAGTAEDEKTLIRAFRDIDWDVRRCVTNGELDQCAAESPDAFIVAGGDGSVAQVATRLAGKGTPIVVVPTGTVNNIARSLGIGIDAKSMIQGLARAMQLQVDLGVSRSARGEERFIEGFGVGLFAYVIGALAEEYHKKVSRARALIAKAAAEYEPRPFRIDIDGRDFSGDYLLVAVMNLRSCGPALTLAPDAQVGDGQLDVVLLRPEKRGSFVAHLERAAKEGDMVLPRYESHRARTVRVRAAGDWAHVDDNAYQLDGEVQIAVEPGSARFLVPGV
jgi:diacylglycerol kinase (ATP)